MNLELSIAKVSAFILMPLIALLFEGIRRKLFARMQNRVGPVILQPFYDIVKLFHKKKSNALGQENLFFRITPHINFFVCWTLFLFMLRMISFEHDFLFLFYLIVLSSVLTILAGMSSDNPFAIIESIRDLMLMICCEIVLAVIIVCVMMLPKINSLSNIADIMVFRLPIAFICFIYIMQNFFKTAPFDSVSAHTEVLEGEETEFSGKGLAYLMMSSNMKNLFFSYLLLFLFVNIEWYFILILSFILTFFIALVNAATCRYKVTQTFSRLTWILILVIFEFIRLRLGWVW